MDDDEYETPIMDQGSPSPAPSKVDLWRTKDVILISAGIIAIFLGAASIYRLYTQITQSQGAGLQQPSIWASLALGLLEGVVLIGCVYYLGMRRKGYSWSQVGLLTPTREWIAISAGLGVLIIPISGLIALVIQLLLGMPLNNPQIPFLAPQGFSWSGLVGMLILGGVIGPLAEELYFRGVVYAWLRQRWGVSVATLASALLFGLAHGEISIAGSAFFLGIILAWTYERSASLWSPVLIHIINNSFKIILLYALLAAGLSPY
jgi:membrane protease YdiL (CAAX protease family)